MYRDLGDEIRSPARKRLVRLLVYRFELILYPNCAKRDDNRLEVRSRGGNWRSRRSIDLNELKLDPDRSNCDIC